MFHSLKQKILLGCFVVLILAIPTGAYFLSQRQTTQLESKPTSPVTKPPPSPSPVSFDNDQSKKSQPTSTSSGTISFGPTINLKLILEGRPPQNQTAKVFIGISEGATESAKPKYLLTFSIDLPADGVFNGLSLAGLSAGNNYFAVIKGSAQLATASAFAMSPSVTSLNNGKPLQLLTGDLNEDNAINSADFAIIKSTYGAIASSPNWNENNDFNKDGIINIVDVGFVLKNFGLIGGSGLWSSTPGGAPQTLNEASSLGVATPSATPSGGYWMWIPSI